MSAKYDDLLKTYRKLAKRADQRLVRLEASSHDKGYENIKKYAYKVAMDDIKRFGGKKRFNTKPPKNTRELQSKISAIERFLNSDTSTKRGVEKIYVKRVKTINDNYGTDFTWQQFKEYFDSNAQSIMNRQYGSKTSLLMIGKAMKKDKDILEEITEYTNNHSVDKSEVFVSDRLHKLGISRAKLKPKDKQ